MGWVSGIVVYLLIWWTVVFCILPVGIASADNAAGAPQNPKLLQKALITTLVSGILWVVVYELIDHNVLNFYDMAEQMAAQDLKTEHAK